jgi:hypothetical protein
MLVVAWSPRTQMTVVWTKQVKLVTLLSHESEQLEGKHNSTS